MRNSVSEIWQGMPRMLFRMELFQTRRYYGICSQIDSNHERTIVKSAFFKWCRLQSDVCVRLAWGGKKIELRKWEFEVKWSIMMCFSQVMGRININDAWHVDLLIKRRRNPPEINEKVRPNSPDLHRTPPNGGVTIATEWASPLLPAAESPAITTLANTI